MKLREEDRQLVLLALAQLALDRPGWDDALRRIAAQLAGEVMYDDFKKLNADRFKLLPWLGGGQRGDLPSARVGRVNAEP